MDKDQLTLSVEEIQNLAGYSAIEARGDAQHAFIDKRGELKQMKDLCVLQHNLAAFHTFVSDVQAAEARVKKIIFPQKHFFTIFVKK